LVKGLEALENLLLKFGGHAAAAGVTLKAKDLPLFEKAFEELAAGSLPETALRPALSIEGEMDFPDLRREVVPYLPNLAPFGAGNPEPILATRGVRIRDRRLVGNGHLRLRLEQKGVILNGIGFGMGEKEIEPGDLIDLAYIPGVSHRGGDSFLQLRIKDLEPS
jgi:single-stranded-DNA-specific exonuclease